MQGDDSLSNPAGISGIQQVMGGSSSGPSGHTRSQVRGRADAAESRTPISGRALGGASIWTAAEAAASNASPSSGGSSADMIALQQQMQLLLIQNQEQAKRHAELLALFGSQKKVVVDLQSQVRAMTVEVDASSRAPLRFEDAPSREQVNYAPASADPIPVGLPVSGSHSGGNSGGQVEFEDGASGDAHDEDDEGEEESKHSDRSPRKHAWAWDAKTDRTAQALELAKIQALNRSSDDIVKTLPKFDEFNYPRWKEKTLAILAQRGCQAVILSGEDPPDTSPDLLAAQRRNAWLLLENSLEKASKSRIITRTMKCNPALLWKALEATYALAPAFTSADSAKEILLKMRQGSGPTSLLTYLQNFEEPVDITQELLDGAHRGLLDDSTLISHCRDGLNKAHQDISLSLLGIRQWSLWKQSLLERSFVAKLSSFSTSGSDGSSDRRSSGGRNVPAERAYAAVGGSDVTCYGCGENGHYKKDCPVPNISTKECRNCGAVGHIVKACKKAPQAKSQGAGASGGSKVQRGKKGGRAEDRPSKAAQALRLLEVAKKERDKIQARADRRANEYAAAARVVAELHENTGGARSSSSSGSGNKHTRFSNNNDEDEDDGVEQYEAPARGGHQPRKGNGKVAMAGGLNRFILFLSLCMACTIPSQASAPVLTSFDSAHASSPLNVSTFYSDSFVFASPVSLISSTGSLDYLQRDRARTAVPPLGPVVSVYHPAPLNSTVFAFDFNSPMSRSSLVFRSHSSACSCDFFSNALSCDFNNPFRM